MKPIGTILHISPHGKIIVRANPNFLPKSHSQQKKFLSQFIGHKVFFTEKVAGSVIDVFGPVKQPYLSIAGSTPYMAKEILSSGALLYIRGKRKRNK